MIAQQTDNNKSNEIDNSLSIEEKDTLTELGIPIELILEEAIE